MTNFENNPNQTTSNQANTINETVSKIAGKLNEENINFDTEGEVIELSNINKSKLKLLAEKSKLSAIDCTSSSIQAKQQSEIEINRLYKSRVLMKNDSKLDLNEVENSRINLVDSELEASEITSTAVDAKNSTAKVGNLNHSHIKINKSKFESGYMTNCYIEGSWENKSRCHNKLYN